MPPTAQLWVHRRNTLPRRMQKTMERGSSMKLKAILLGSVLAAASVATADAAANNRGWYVGVEGGANWMQNVDDHFDAPGGAFDTTLNVDFDTGWAAIATVGYAFWESNWRVEVEAGYRQTDINTGAFEHEPFGP